MNICIHTRNAILYGLLCCVSVVASGYSLSALADPIGDDTNCDLVDGILADNLKRLYAQPSYSDNYDASSDENRIDTSNIIIDSLLKQYLTKPDSLSCEFKQAESEGLQRLTSANNNFNVYGWDLATGGTMHNYARLIQYQDRGGKLHLQDQRGEADGGSLHSFANALFTTNVSSGNGNPVYLLITTGVFSTMDNSANLTTYQLNGNTLTHPKVIKTASGLTNTLSFAYDFFSVVDRPERPIQLFEYDDKTKTIRFPVVIEDSEYPVGKVTDRKIEYQYDGQYFQRVKN